MNVFIYILCFYILLFSFENLSCESLFLILMLITFLILIQEALKTFVEELLPCLQDKLSNMTSWIYYLVSVMNLSEVELQNHAKIYMLHKEFTKVVEENVLTSHGALKKFQDILVVSFIFRNIRLSFFHSFIK